MDFLEEILPIKITEELIMKLVKFIAVGFVGLIVDFGITYLFKEIFKVQKYVANAFGFIIAASTNYLLNRVWTFNSHNPDILKEYSHFLIISVIGLGINSLVLWFLISRFKYKFYYAKFVAIVITTGWNFVANVMFTFTQG